METEIKRGRPRKIAPENAAENVTPDPISELKGFEVFRICRAYKQDENVCQIIINKNDVRLTKRCLDLLKHPEYIVAFFDSRGKRLMIVPGTKNTVNALSISGKSYGNIHSKQFFAEVRKQAGIQQDGSFRYRALGHQVNTVSPTLIFDLANLSELQPWRKNAQTEA